MKKNNQHEGELDFIESIIESKSKYRKIVQAAIAQWVKDYQEGKIKINTVSDLRTLIQIEIDLQNGILIDNRKANNRRNLK